MNNEIRPFLRWAGSKRQILDELDVFGHGSSRYVEPFVGSACLFFRKQPSSALLGDLNADLIATYRTVRRSSSSVHAVYSSWTNDEAQYRHVRALDEQSLSETARAARFIYLNRFCFNGLFRTNQQGKFNVPYGGLRSGVVPSLEHLQNCSRLLKRAVLVHGTFQDTLRQVRKGDFVYMDPPFSVAARRVFKEYNATVFSDDDVRTLRRWIEHFANTGIPFLVSYAESAEADFLSYGFKIKRVNVKRHIAGNFSNRVVCPEVLIYA